MKNSEYYQKRKAELQQALAQEWINRGQAAKRVEDCDRQIGFIEHRLDELERKIQAEKEAESPTEPPKE